jgi:hypothetical protein
MYSIRRSAGGWELLDEAGARVGEEHASYDAAIAALAGLLGQLAELAADDPARQEAIAAGSPPPGALPRRWSSGPLGEGMQDSTGPYRDFSQCEFTYRTGGAPLPLMLMTEDGHGGFGGGVSRLAGWSDDDRLVDGAPHSAGWLHDNEAGNELARILDAQGSYGVSLDPGENVDADFVCTEYDDDGFCVAETVSFTAYEIAGRTGVPFPGFAMAMLQWEDAGAAPAVEEQTIGEGIAASGAPVYRDPDPAYLTMVPPPLDDSRWVAQRATGLPAIPIEIGEPDADGWAHVYGFIGAAGVCHIGYRDECVTLQPSPSGYANFHLFTQVDRDGGRHNVGRLVYGRDHVPLAGVSLHAARDNYANTHLAWANVVATDCYAPEGAVWNGEPIGGTFLGAWFTGVVHRHVSAEARAVLRSGGVSGDWREEQVHNVLGELDLVGCQSCNVPGFPVTRHALAAAGIELADAGLSVSRRAGRIVGVQGLGIVERAADGMDALVASGTVRCGTCPEPAGPFAATGRTPLASVRGRADARAARVAAQERDARLGRLEATLERALAVIGVVEGRTRHLAGPEAEARAAALRELAGTNGH